MRKKPKNAQPVTEETPEKLIEEAPPQVEEPKEALKVEEAPAKPTLEERLQKIENLVPVISNNFDQIGAAIAKLQPLLDVVEKMGQRAEQQQNSSVPAGGGGMGGLGLILQAMQAMGGGASNNPLEAKMTKVTDAILDKTLEGILNPPESLIEKYLKEETAKKIARSLAEQGVKP